MKIKKLLLGTLAVTAGLTLAACSNGSQNQVKEIKSKGTLTVALSPDYPPFEFQTIKNGKNTVVGSDVDLAKAIGKSLGVKVKISSMNFDNVLTAVSGGKADIAISGISVKPSREKSFDFSKTYYDPTNYVVVRKADLDKYTSLSDFSGKNLAAQKGSVQEQIVQSDFKGATEIPLTAIGDEINEVSAGKIQGAVIENLIAKSYVAANPDLAIAKVTIPNPKDNYGYAVAMPKGSKELKKKVNALITKMLADGEIQKQIQTNYTLSQNTK